TAELCVEQAVICSRIPDNSYLKYNYNEIKRCFGDNGKLFLNIGNALKNAENVRSLCSIKAAIDKCIGQVKIQRSFELFLSFCNSKGTANTIKRRIQQSSIDNIIANPNVSLLVDCVKRMNDLPSDWQEIDSVFTAMQICQVLKSHYDNGENDILKKVLLNLEYKEQRIQVDDRLSVFNTTGRIIKTKETHGKLVVDFERANSMSNGERDVLSFIASLSCFERQIKKDVGILIIDEVFDYLDGCNLLAVQYYLMQTIEQCKNDGKILFPLILTHLDPEVFGNYYFKKKKIHYLSSNGIINLNSDIVKLLRLRENSTITDNEKDEIAKYFFHYHPDRHILSDGLRNAISGTFSGDSMLFKENLYNEVINKYLEDHQYNPVMVIAAVRIKIEETLYLSLNACDQNDFIKQHKTIKKLSYAEEKGIDSPELFYLLQPLYNDGLHLSGNDSLVTSKIKSAYLKTNNLHITKFVRMIFSSTN
ncbi:MAG: hypothetical protein GX424_01635, partial [Clostridiales bacterium]|nr:hypothetical protein [Clostridiales bacterium]